MYGVQLYYPRRPALVHYRAHDTKSFNTELQTCELSSMTRLLSLSHAQSLRLKLGRSGSSHVRAGSSLWSPLWFSDASCGSAAHAACPHSPLGDLQAAHPPNPELAQMWTRTLTLSLPRSLGLYLPSCPARTCLSESVCSVLQPHHYKCVMTR